MSNASSSLCPRCGASLAGGSVDGLCAHCLGALNFETQTIMGDEKGAAPAVPLRAEELAPHFPQLEILDCLGRGGMGVVYKARQKSLDRLVALKLLAPERADDPEFAARFAREAQALAKLSHPNIVAVHDFGWAGGFYFLLMEFVDGVNLRQAMGVGRFTAEQAIAVVPPVCEALQYAHERGIVHRDIKPENLLLDKDGRVKIADFGIAKMLGEDAGSGEVETMPAGTPQYMAPEQKDHHGADHRADIYSLGVVLYEMLTGELPAGHFQPPSSRVRGVRIDVRLDEIVLRALEKTPELRYQTATELRTQVESVRAAATSRSQSQAAGRSPAEVKARTMAAAIALGLFIIGSFALFFRFMGAKHDDPRSTPAITLNFATNPRSAGSVVGSNLPKPTPQPRGAGVALAPIDPPQLRFIAWQDEWDGNRRAVWHPDGSAVTDATELELLRGLLPTRLETGQKKTDPAPRILLLWFAHSLFAQTTFRKVSLLDEQGKALPPVGSGEFSSGAYAATTRSDHLGWLTYGLSPGVGQNIPPRVTVRLHYTAGPLEDVRDVEVTSKNHIVMALPGGSLLNGAGQNANGKSFVSIAVDVSGMKSRRFGALALTKDGRELDPDDGFAGGSAGAGVRVEDFSFPVPLAEVVKFRIGTRPIRMEQWKDVALPGMDSRLPSATESGSVAPEAPSPFSSSAH